MNSKTTPEPQDAKEYFNRGVACLDKREWDNAIADFSKAIALNPEYVEAYFSRGFAYENAEEWDSAIADYGKAIDLNPQDATAYFFRGLAYENAEEWDNAIADYTKARDLSPEDADAYFFRGVAYGKKGEPDNAIADYTNAIEINPQNADAYFNRGVAYENTEKWDNAIADYTKAIDFNPQNADAYFNRGLAYENTEEWDNAIADYTKAIDFNPQDATAHFHRGLAYENTEEWDNAIADFGKAIDFNPQDANAHLSRGFIYLEKLEKPERGTAFLDFVCAGKKEPASKSKYTEVYVASIIEDVIGNGKNPKGIDKDAIIENFFKILMIAKNIQRALFCEQSKDNKPQEPTEVAHYTSLDTLKNLVNKGCFRLYNSVYMNDQEEGHVFFELMNKSARKYLEEKIYGTDDISYRSPAYIGSFIPVDPKKSTDPKKQKDKLPLWRTYGKQNGEEASGSCLIFTRGQFAKNHRSQVGHMWTKSMSINSKEKQDSRPLIYKIAYKDTKATKELSKDLNEMATCLRKVGGIIKKIPAGTEGKSKQDKLKQLVRELLDSIRFLFKASHYEEENEVRVLQLYYPKEKSDKIKVDTEQIPPRFYLATPKSFCFSEVILGRQAQNFQEWKKWIDEQDLGVKVERSGIKYGSRDTQHTTRH